MRSEPAPAPPADLDASRTIIVRLSPLAHRALRVRVAEEDTSIQQWVEALIGRELGLRKPPPGPERAAKRTGK